MINITIHRGTNEIGGSCVELSTGSCRILIDVGQPLDGRECVLPESLRSVDAVLISHPHEDHHGLIEQLSNEVPVYMGSVSWNLINAARIFRGKDALTNQVSFIDAWKPFQIGQFEIFPYLMDHSTPEAFAFLIKVEGKAVFYSGDFRGHGRKAKVLDHLVSHPPGQVDALIMEGTMMARSNAVHETEAQVEDAMVVALKSSASLVFLQCSSQNIDRLVSAYRACLKSGRIFVIDIYTAWVLRLLSSRGFKVPDLAWDRVRVLSKGRTASWHYGVLKDRPNMFGSFVRELYAAGNLIEESELRLDPARYLIKSNRISYLIENLGLESSTVIYSMWEGYLSPEHNSGGYKHLDALRTRLDVDFQLIHTSGHAVVDDLKRLAQALKPTVIIPIHTEQKRLYVDHFANVNVLEDGQVFEL